MEYQTSQPGLYHSRLLKTRSMMASSFPSSSSSSNLSASLESITLQETNSNFAPWLDLRDYLTEKFLERLPFLDYARFGAVCPKWRSIQQNHRRRHSPSPPPMLNLPWFVTYQPQQEAVDCFSPFEQRSHRIRLPFSRRHLERGSESRDGRSWRSSLSNGWLVRNDVPPPVEYEYKYYFTLLNPISGAQIELPGVGESLLIDCKNGCKLSGSPPPGCLVFLMAVDKWNLVNFLFREGDEYWTELEFPDNDMRSGALIEETCALVWEGKVYYMYRGWGLMVIDPLPSDPTIEFLEMDQSQLPTQKYGWGEDDADVFHYVKFFMVESDGKMLLVVEFFESTTCSPDELVVDFQVFEANFSIKSWVRLESLGDRVLFIHQNVVCSLLADDIGVEGSCIYFTDPCKIEESCPQNSSRVGPLPWNVFNLGTGKLTESPLSHAPTSGTQMFVPSLP